MGINRFRAKVIRIGTSAGVIIPKEMLDRKGLKVGEKADFSIVITEKDRLALIEKMAGSVPGIGKGWKRDKDRTEKLLKLTGRPIKQASQ
jgi:hypothetical protein